MKKVECNLASRYMGLGAWFSTHLDGCEIRLTNEEDESVITMEQNILEFIDSTPILIL